ncbi:VOC family protein [Fulvitalea axinellae]|uniref:VOC family protein n=1 Tax=Fulvitalea axinellae TaxID=1182444 RepID=A0AAU9CLM4_9BACT|nr:VOC family protein [Fulvitalea axinellae]
MQQMIPYLMVDGAEEAGKFYSEAFEGEILETHRAGDIPGFPSPDAIIHLSIQTKYGLIFLADSHPERTMKGNNTQIVFSMGSPEEVDSVVNSLREGAMVHMEPQNTFWGAYFATLTDKYGITWQMNCQLDQKA